LLKEFEDSEATLFVNGSLDPDINDSIVWTGEVLEVDEATGRIFIVVTNPEYRISEGERYFDRFDPQSKLDIDDKTLIVVSEPQLSDGKSVLAENGSVVGSIETIDNSSD
jgi:hypothetical protein